MTCLEFQDLITAAVDRLLPAEFQEAFADHLEKCSSCRDDYELEGTTKLAVQTHVRMVPTPSAMLEAIRAEVRSDGPARGAAPLSWLKRPWAASYLRPMIGFAVGCAVVVFALNRWGLQPISSPDSAVNDNVILQSLTNYHALVSGDIKPQMVSSEPELLRQFFEGKTEFPVLVPAMKECTLVGGVVNDYSGTPLAHIVYRHDSGIVYVYQACWNTVMKGEKLRIPEEAKNELRRTGWFVETHPDGDTLVLWRKGNTLCAAVARMSKENLIACLTSENAADANAW